MNDLLLEELGNVIEELYRYKQDSDCFTQQQEVEQMITTLNKVYDTLVYMGA
jgi:hypothetical protein